MRFLYRAGEREHEVEVAPDGDGRFRVTVDGTVLELAASLRGDALELTSHAGTARVWVSRDGALRYVTAPGLGDVVLEREERRRGAEETGGGLASPMPGKVVKVLAAPGDAVAKGDTLVVVEAMKTELTIVAPRAATVAAVHVEPGQMCDAGVALVDLAEP